VVDTANFLNMMGASIKGAGTDVIRITGVDALRGGEYTIIPDQIEAGTFMAAVAATGGRVVIKDVIPKHLECVSGKLREMGVSVMELDDSIIVQRTGSLLRTHLKTMPYPGFPTDMQPQMAVVLCQAAGMNIITEGVWDNRFRYVDELAKMGASIRVTGRTAIIEGVSYLTGAPIKAGDLRAGAALVIAGLSARGKSEIEGVHYIERGYEDMVEKLKALGAEISVAYVPDSNMMPARAVI
jgi:UDP-N-acetylglucosamine 1-carboxyvinyltransferase